MLNRSVILSMLAVLLCATLLLAHGAPLMGTITEVGKDSITIKDKAGKSTVVMFEKTTKFVQDKKAVAQGDLQVGMRVVIDAHMDAKTKKYTAEEVQVGVAAAAAATKTATATPKKAAPKKP